MSATETFGAYLKRLRTERHFTLRQVEAITSGRISNALLSQMETGAIQSPSVLKLHQLSAAYGVDFGELCERACAERPIPLPPTFCPTCGHVMAFSPSPNDEGADR